MSKERMTDEDVLRISEGARKYLYIGANDELCISGGGVRFILESARDCLQPKETSKK